MTKNLPSTPGSIVKHEGEYWVLDDDSQFWQHAARDGHIPTRLRAEEALSFFGHDFVVVLFARPSA